MFPILFDVYLEAVSRLAKSIPNSIFKVSSGTDMVLDIEYADDYDVIAFTQHTAERGKEQATDSIISSGIKTNGAKSNLYEIGRPFGGVANVSGPHKLKQVWFNG